MKKMSNLGKVMTKEELKFVVGGEGFQGGGTSGGGSQSGNHENRPCPTGAKLGQSCTWNGRLGVCRHFPFSYGLICWVG